MTFTIIFDNLLSHCNRVNLPASLEKTIGYHESILQNDYYYVRTIKAGKSDFREYKINLSFRDDIKKKDCFVYLQMSMGIERSKKINSR